LFFRRHPPPCPLLFPHNALLPTFPLLAIHHHPEHKIHYHRRKKANGQHRRSKPIIKPGLPALPNTARAPMEHIQAVHHSAHGNQREDAGGNLPDSVAEVKKADGEAAEDNREVEPGEEGAFVGEENFGFNACGERDAFA
jgi:pyruvate/2-oxoacid:ferredoxin oxidoreductase alpha subunit